MRIRRKAHPTCSFINFHRKWLRQENERVWISRFLPCPLLAITYHNPTGIAVSSWKNWNFERCPLFKKLKPWIRFYTGLLIVRPWFCSQEHDNCLLIVSFIFSTETSRTNTTGRKLSSWLFFRYERSSPDNHIEFFDYRIISAFEKRGMKKYRRLF